MTTADAPSITLGLRANWPQFSLLVLINAFVGGMVGLERTVVPLIGSEEFKIASTTLVASFIISFGVIKALANLVFGHLADVWATAALPSDELCQRTALKTIEENQGTGAGFCAIISGKLSLREGRRTEFE